MTSTTRGTPNRRCCPPAPFPRRPRDPFPRRPPAPFPSLQPPTRTHIPTLIPTPTPRRRPLGRTPTHRRRLLAPTPTHHRRSLAPTPTHRRRLLAFAPHLCHLTAIRSTRNPTAARRSCLAVRSDTGAQLTCPALMLAYATADTRAADRRIAGASCRTAVGTQLA